MLVLLLLVAWPVLGRRFPVPLPLLLLGCC